MARNVRTYDHFCVLARALEHLGDRWSLLVVRDLMTGPKRFTDLMDRLGGITPKTLTGRLRGLEDAGVVVADRQADRREVWYALTPAGADLAPAVEALSAWGWEHAWRPPRAGEPLHGEHLLRALVLFLDRSGDDRPDRTRWLVRFVDDGTYEVVSDGSRWELTHRPDRSPGPGAETSPPPVPPGRAGGPGGPGEAVDLVVTVTAAGLADLVAEPGPERAVAVGLRLDGEPAAARDFHERLAAFSAAVRERPVAAP